MTTPSHIITGIAIGSVIAKTTPVDISDGLTVLLIFFNVGLALAPDANLLWHKHISTHHRDFTHYPVVLLVVSMAVLALELVFGNSSLLISKSVFVSLFTHMLMDTFGMTIGIHWLWPFSKREFSFTPLIKDRKYNSIRESLQMLSQHSSLSYEIVWDIVVLIVSVVVIAS